MKNLILLSGGIDSTVVLGWLIDKFGKDNMYGIFFNYGQSHLKQEEKAVDIVVKKTGITLEKVKLPFIKENRLGMGELVEETEYNGIEVSPAFLPLRNPLFLTIACMKAISLGIRDIVAGYTIEDYSGFPDCRHDFICAFETMLAEALGGVRLTIHTPLISMNKLQIVDLGKQLGMEGLLKQTWSCYRGGKKPCGVCDACKVRAKGGI